MLFLANITSVIDEEQHVVQWVTSWCTQLPDTTTVTKKPRTYLIWKWSIWQADLFPEIILFPLLKEQIVVYLVALKPLLVRSDLETHLKLGLLRL